MADDQNKTLLKFSKWYKITLIVGIFTLIVSAVHTTMLLIYEIKRAKGLYFNYEPLEFQLAMYIAFFVFAAFRSIGLGFLTKMRKSDRVSRLTVFNVIQIVVAIGLGIISIIGILHSIGEMLQDRLIPYRTSWDILFFGAIAIMGLEIFAWAFFYSYIKRKAEEDLTLTSKKIRTGIIVYIVALGTPIILFFFILAISRLFGPFDVFDIGGPVNLNYLAVFLNALIVFMIFSNYLIGLLFQFRMVNGIMSELE